MAFSIKMDGFETLSFMECLKHPFSCPYHTDPRTCERSFLICTIGVTILLGVVGVLAAEPVGLVGAAFGTVLVLLLRSIYHDHGASQAVFDELTRRQNVH